MSGLEEHNSVKATTCVITTYHRPKPVRFVWHHIQPQEAGGLTVDNNLAQVCDNCHYTVHRLMWNMAKNLPLPKVLGKQLDMATLGYGRCIAAGTVDKIPNEG